METKITRLEDKLASATRNLARTMTSVQERYMQEIELSRRSEIQDTPALQKEEPKPSQQTSGKSFSEKLAEKEASMHSRLLPQKNFPEDVAGKETVRHSRQPIQRRFSAFGGSTRGPTPERFLSHNPFMHSPLYEETNAVKQAAWTFRRSSLQSQGPSEDVLSGAIAAERAGHLNSDIGEDTIDGLLVSLLILFTLFPLTYCGTT